MKLDRQLSYLAPEGELTGTIISGELKTDEKNGKTRESVRLTISVDPIPSDPMNEYRVRVDYWATQANQLMHDAHRLVGSKASEMINCDGEIRPDKLGILEGKRVKFTVIHDRKPGHKEAYRKVVNLGTAD